MCALVSISLRHAVNDIALCDIAICVYINDVAICV